MSAMQISILVIIHRVSDCFREGSIARKYYSFRSHSAIFRPESVQQLRQKKSKLVTEAKRLNCIFSNQAGKEGN